MASTCCEQIADTYHYGSTLEFSVPFLKPPASSEAQPLGYPACFSLSTVDKHAILSNDPALPFLRGFPRHPKQVLDLTVEDGKHDDATEVSRLRNTRTGQYCVRLNLLFLTDCFQSAEYFPSPATALLAKVAPTQSTPKSRLQRPYMAGSITHSHILETPGSHRWTTTLQAVASARID